MKPVIAQILTKGVNGGVEAVVLNYCRHLSDSFHFIFLIENESEIVNSKVINSIGGELVIVPPYKHLLEYTKFLKSFFLSRKDIQVVHSNLSTMSFLPLRTAKKCHIPIRISEAHSTDSKAEKLRSVLKHIFRHLTNRYLTDKFACSILAGEFQYGHSEVNNNNVFILPNAIEISRFRFSIDQRLKTRHKLGLSESDFVIGHIGRFVSQKNHAFLINIMKQLNNKQIKLLLLGEGEKENEIRELVNQLGLQSQVIFAGTTSHPEDYYSAFDLFCLPSLYEGLPVVAVEAQANGLPLLLADTITKECKILPTTFFLSISDISSWVNKISQSLSSPKSRNVDISLFSDFDIDVQKEKLRAKYFSLLEGKND
ncbi:MAG TPA: glycosyltransferase [Candidatus Enterosoma merdigallinarum]|nr:glycosyltransferase [Candidatus Enterosoma merdigallinarum]